MSTTSSTSPVPRRSSSRSSKRTYPRGLVERSLAFERGRRDPVAFARNVGIEKPDPWQADFLSSSSDRVLLNCSRQAGKSSSTSIVSLHTALYKPDSLILVLAPALRQAQEFFDKLKHFYHASGKLVPALNDRELSLNLANGSRIVALPGSERTIRGFSGVDLLILDEASRVEDSLYYAVRPMLAVSGGRLMMLSSPFGKRGVFYEEWQNGVGWERYEITAYDCPRITEEFLEEERATLPARIFRQEYLCSFEETEDQFFGHDLVGSAVSDEVTPLFEGA